MQKREQYLRLFNRKILRKILDPRKKRWIDDVEEDLRNKWIRRWRNYAIKVWMEKNN